MWRLPPLSAWLALLAVTCVKVLLVPSYASTDFDVHRNWLAVTHGRPLREWYYEATSEWTLDYPPLFAWFEFSLAHVARLCDAAMLRITAEPYRSAATLYFQRASVMLSDLILFAAAWSFVQTMSSTGTPSPATEVSPSSSPSSPSPSLSSTSSTRASSFAASTSPRQRRQSTSASTSAARSVASKPPPSATPASAWLPEAQHAVVTALVVLNAGLLLVDHIHFQYNGMLLGALIYSVSLVRQGRDLEAGVVFAVLLNMKHLFLYLAPAYFVYLWRHFCTRPAIMRFDDDDAHRMPESPLSPLLRSSLGSLWPRASAAATAAQPSARTLPPPTLALDASKTSGAHTSKLAAVLGEILPLRLFALGACVVGVFAVSLAPLVVVGGFAQLAQLKARLFPFTRGLVHAYWAPNVWALYACADRVLLAARARLAPFLVQTSVASVASNVTAASVAAAGAVATPSLTRGLVGDASAAFAVLPTPPPALISIMVLAAMLPALRALWQRPHPRVFLATLVHCALVGFLLGWHVHEKAALVHVLLLALSAADSTLDAHAFTTAALVCDCTLLPLLLEARELPVKLALVACHTSLIELVLGAHVTSELRRRRIAKPVLASRLTRTYLHFGAPLVVIAAEFVLPALWPRLPFAPLMLTSVWGALGNLYVAVLVWRVLARLMAVTTHDE